MEAGKGQSPHNVNTNVYKVAEMIRTGPFSGMTLDDPHLTKLQATDTRKFSTLRTCILLDVSSTLIKRAKNKGDYYS